MFQLYLAPYIVPEFHLRHSQVGMLASVLAITWAISTRCMVGSHRPQTNQYHPAHFNQTNPAESFRQSLHNIIDGLHPAIITTATDVPATTDVKQLSRLWEEIHR